MKRDGGKKKGVGIVKGRIWSDSKHFDAFWGRIVFLLVLVFSGDFMHSQKAASLNF